MTALKIKQSLLEIAGRIKPTTTLEEVFQQLALLSDIETSELQEKQGKVITQSELKKKSKKWLK